MGYLSGSLNLAYRSPEFVKRTIYTGATIYKGAFCELRSDGYLNRWQNDGSAKFAGVAEESTIAVLSGTSPGANGGSSPVSKIKVKRTGLVRVPFTGAAIGNVGNSAYISTDDQTVNVSSGTQIGVVVDWESGYLWIDITGYAV